MKLHLCIECAHHIRAMSLHMCDVDHNPRHPVTGLFLINPPSCDDMRNDPALRDSCGRHGSKFVPLTPGASDNLQPCVKCVFCAKTNDMRPGHNGMMTAMVNRRQLIESEARKYICTKQIDEPPTRICPIDGSVIVSAIVEHAYQSGNKLVKGYPCTDVRASDNLCGILATAYKPTGIEE